MSRFTKAISSPRFNIVLFVIAAVLLLGSIVGGTQAALSYYSDTYWARLMSSDIGVTLIENDQEVAYRNYNTNGSWNYRTHTDGTNNADGRDATLLTNTFDDGLVAGKRYDEVLKVQNTGYIDQYVRVTLTKYFEDPTTHEKVTTASPDLIQLDLNTTAASDGSQWIVDEDASTSPEQTVLYYNMPLSGSTDENGETSIPFCTGITIDGAIADTVKDVQQTTENGVTTYTTTYSYNGMNACLEASVYAVQQHNIFDAIISAWGKYLNVDNGQIRP